MCEYGVGIRERILPGTRFEVPLDEFSRALELNPTLVLPLKITDEEGKMVLTPLLMEERADGPLQAAFELDDKSLGEDLRKTAPPPAVPPTAPPPALETVHEAPTRPNLPALPDSED